LPTKTANAINAEAIMKELQRRGHSVTCIAVNQNHGPSFLIQGSIPIYAIRSSRYGSLLQRFESTSPGVLDRARIGFWGLVRRARIVFSLGRFPDVARWQSRAVLRLAEQLHRKERFDCIVGVFRPFSGVSAAIGMKKKYPGVICGAYYLDLISGAAKPRFIPKTFYDRLCYSGEVNAFRQLDFVLMAKAGQAIYSAPKYDCVSQKIHYVDFPLFQIEKPTCRSCSFDRIDGGINLVYAGLLDKDYRNPTFMLEVLQKVSEVRPGIVLHLYGRGSGFDIVRSFKRRAAFDIRFYGMVDHDEVLSAMSRADFLTSIGNRNRASHMVPSKIFELFSTGKPIIAFFSNKRDVSLEYFAKYPLSCLLNEWDGVQGQADRLARFLEEQRGMRCDVEELQSAFAENTPEYTVDIIEHYLKRGRGHHVQS
jgi:glycosyltransferase involved in cell wall biosynthesis